jgi:hypothetical protein
VNKAIAQWNKWRWADLDNFGHFDAQIFAASFVANRSFIGTNAYALSIKADPEAPKQAAYLVNRNYRCKTFQTPILLD